MAHKGISEVDKHLILNRVMLFSSNLLEQGKISPGLREKGFAHAWNHRWHQVSVIQ